MKNNNEEYVPKHANNYNTNYHLYDNIQNNEQMVKRKKKRRIKNWVWNVLIVFFLSMTIGLFVLLWFWHKDNVDTFKVSDDISKDTEIIELEDDENTELIGSSNEEETSDYWYYIKFSLYDVDIQKLKEKNVDTVGWINVNNTNINYPYVQYRDNDYYLNHSFDKSYNEAGWVFMDYRNRSDLNNKNTILYAHSRLDKTMFGSLSKVLKKEWYTNKDNHIIRISTEKDNTLWQIFSVYKIKEESYYITTDFVSDSSYMDFLNTIKSRSIYNFNTNLTSEDRILTLSTCYSDSERTVVHAKLIKRSSK
ncbi:MAG: class B sortase [Erysipelotrichaceae bacterium]|nr:class B sortase [Erysipelotrichaceae bacterium]